MPYAICHLGSAPLRKEPAHTSEMLSQVLYGESFTILEERKDWARIRTSFDACEAWIDLTQYQRLSEEEFQRMTQEEVILSADLIEYVTRGQELIPIPIGSVLNACAVLKDTYSCASTRGLKPKEALIETALMYLNAPFLWGGKTPLGIDAAGFTQMVYKLNGYQLPRTPASQALEGESLSFIEECQPGDLAFFDDKEGNIDHVAIVMQDNYVIHVRGKVRLDRIDHSGIYNPELRRHTHPLRVIKRIF